MTLQGKKKKAIQHDNSAPLEDPVLAPSTPFQGSFPWWQINTFNYLFASFTFLET